ncbi:MAG: DUF721 domain-containing protein [Thermodesulfobacteriota bacterium]|nr:DUF721 domain-containing protein [Thermodesulfobacteriota bacterium]
MKHISSVFEDAFIEIGCDFLLKERLVSKVWKEVVGEYIAQQTQIESVRGNKIFVKVSSHIWVSELTSMKGMIIERMRKRLKKKEIEEIHFVQGEIDTSHDPILEPADEKIHDKEICEDYQTDTRKDLLQIKDPEIRETLSRIMHKHSQLRKNRGDQM